MNPVDAWRRAVDNRLDHPETEPLSNPLSLRGSAIRIMRGVRWLAWHGWAAPVAWAGAALLLLVAWVVVLAWYALLCSLLGLPWIFWGIHTLNRRHHIHDRRRALMGQPG